MSTPFGQHVCHFATSCFASKKDRPMTGRKKNPSSAGLVSSGHVNFTMRSHDYPAGMGGFGPNFAGVFNVNLTCFETLVSRHF